MGMETVNKMLFKECMMGNWSIVKDIYSKRSSARVAKITRAEDTVLHVAISEATYDDVKQLLDVLKLHDNNAAGDNRRADVQLVARADVQLQDHRQLVDVQLQDDNADVQPPDDSAAGIAGAKDVLALANESGNTALHLAAGLGLVNVCTLLAEMSPALVVDARNVKGETPLFVAAKNGKKKAFFALQDKVPKGEVISHCRRSDGNTILHIAVYGEYFDLAFEIIHLYPKLVNFYNERGQTALQLLADKPLVFRSGSRIRRLDSLIYACIIVDPLKYKYPEVRVKTQSNGLQSQESKSMLPENYQTCTELFAVLTHVFNLIVACFDDRSRKSCFIAGGNSTPVEKDEEHGGLSNQASDGEPEQEQAYDDSLTESRFPKNYTTCFNFFKIAMKALLVVLGIGIRRIDKIKRKKQKNTHACQLMDELVVRASHWEYDVDGKNPYKDNGKNGSLPGFLQPPQFDAPNEKEKTLNEPEADTPVLVAAKRGVTEMVSKILDTFPVAVQDHDSDHKNIVLLAVEHRQPHVYRLMLERKKMKESVFGMVDKEGNSALHLAATLGQSRPWIIPGAALQMQWEIKWYKFVKNSMEPSFFSQYNNKGQTARGIFSQNHESLVKDGGEWLTNTSQSCSVVAALIATVAFASATTVPGGVQQTGFPTLEGQPVFDAFAIAALIALCFSVTSLIMFLSILTSRYQEMDFENDLPTKLLLGLTTLFTSIAAMLVSFCAGHFFVIEKKLKYAAYPIYAITCLPVTFFAVAQFPLYLDLIKATMAKVPERTYKTHTF